MTDEAAEIARREVIWECLDAIRVKQSLAGDEFDYARTQQNIGIERCWRALEELLAEAGGVPDRARMKAPPVQSKQSA